jgi:hypothetical protein
LRQFEGETFSQKSNYTSCSEAMATKCAFNQCIVRAAPGSWNRFSDISLRDVSHWNCSISGAAVERVMLHNLKKVGSAPLFLWGSVFRNVKLSGRIAGIKINRDLHIPRKPTEQHNWDQRVLAYYDSVDWAIDISEAKFPGGTSFEAIPGNLVIRDPTTQALIKRQSLAGRDWRALNYDGTAINVAISWFESASLFDSVVVVARSDPKYAARDLRVLDTLRTEGIAEPD